jgi:imidazoleglycerol phosphate synthase glutamine amidotransferase subunit HisH
VVQPKLSVLRKGSQNYLFGKIRDHVQYERAIMAVRFNYFVGTQFHPEADPMFCFPS